MITNYANFDFLYNAENRKCGAYFLCAQRAKLKNYREAWDLVKAGPGQSGMWKIEMNSDIIMKLSTHVEWGNLSTSWYRPVKILLRFKMADIFQNGRH